jgi:hypothetical protein
MSDQVGSSPAAKNVRAALIIAGVQVGGALLLSFANKQGMIDSEATKRGVMVLVGLGLAAAGNRMPKHPDGPQPRSLPVAALRQSVLRASGWAMTLAGLAFAGLWAFAPRDVAQPGSVVAVGAMMAVMFGYVGWRIFTHHRSSTS